MKVRDLIEKLSRLDPDLDVLCYSEDDALVPPGHLFRLLEIEGVDMISGERRRGDDQVPTIAMTDGRAAEQLAIIGVIADF